MTKLPVAAPPEGATQAELRKAARFAFAVLARHYENYSDGVTGEDLQPLAVEHGIIRPVEMLTPCSSDDCNCADMIGEGERTLCYRYTPEMLALRASLHD